MKLTPEQTQSVAQWLETGASIAEVQRRIREEFDIALTYMDTRFLIDDLGLNLAPPPKKEPPPVPPAESKTGDDSIDPEFVDDTGDLSDLPSAETDDPLGAGGSVSVDVDRVTRPGTVVSGSVTFSDGNSGKWALDQLGRLVFEANVSGYRPSEADLQAFQRELSAQLQRQGF